MATATQVSTEGERRRRRSTSRRLRIVWAGIEIDLFGAEPENEAEAEGPVAIPSDPSTQP